MGGGQLPHDRGVPGGRPPGLALLVAVGVAFTGAQLLFVSPRTGLSWDESVYVSQVSGHAPAAWFDPARARGVPLLVAPVAALTGSVVAWSALGCLAAVGLFLRVALGRGGRWSLAGLGACVAFVTLVRPGDAVYLAAPLLVTVPAVRGPSRAGSGCTSRSATS